MIKEQFYRDIEIDLLWEHYLDLNDNLIDSIQEPGGQIDYDAIKELDIIYKEITNRPYEEKEALILSLKEDFDNLERFIDEGNYEEFKMNGGGSEYCCLRAEIIYFAHEFSFPNYMIKDDFIK